MWVALGEGHLKYTVQDWEINWKWEGREEVKEKAQLLQADMRIQQDALDMVKEQLKMLQDSKLQVRGQFHVSGRRNRRKEQSSMS